MKIENLNVKKGDKQILKDLSVFFEENKIHILMGQNGCGKSTLVNTIAGHPDCEVLSGKVFFNSINLLDLEVHERALNGIYLSPQYPPVIEGLSHATLLKESLNAKQLFNKEEEVDSFQFLKNLRQSAEKFSFDVKNYPKQSFNSGFSGGEKKRNEVLQIDLLQPKFVFMDEIDSGLDIEAMKNIANFIKSYKNSGHTLVIITHYPNFAELIDADYFHIMKDGKISQTGGSELLAKVISTGFKEF
jgi:Fe-S cluster assembly ATP-binding protein